MSNLDEISYKRCSIGLHQTDSESGLIHSLRKGRPSIMGIAGRTVLLDVFRLLGLQKDDAIAIPAFYPHGLAIPIKRFGLVPYTYACDNLFSPVFVDIDKIHSKHKLKALIAIHFFGIKIDLSKLNEYCQKNGICLIEDCAQALDLYTDCDYCYNSIVLYSFTKYFSVPDGAMAVYSSYHVKDQTISKSTLLHKACGKAAIWANLISLVICSKVYMSRFPRLLKLSLKQVAKLFYGLYYLIICRIPSNLYISSFSLNVIDHIDYKGIFEMRGRNAQILIESLVSLPNTKIKSASFGVVLICRNKETKGIIHELQSNGIYPMQFKSGWYLDNQMGSIFGSFVLLPVNEHLNTQHMNRIAKVAIGAFS